MKQKLDRHQERLTDTENQTLWKRLRQAQTRPESVWQLAGRRWSLSFGIAVVAIFLVGITTALLLHSTGKRPDIMTVELLPSSELAHIPRAGGSIQLVADGTESASEASRLSGAFGHFAGNPFVSADGSPVSTFEVDTGASSYAITRRYLESDILPPLDVVRVEEFMNSFDQGYPVFTSPDFRIYGEGAPSPFGDGYDLLRIGLQARSTAPEDYIPIDLIFVVDVSRSPASEKRLTTIKESLRFLAKRLGHRDRMGIVVSGGEGRMKLEPVGTGQRASILGAIEELETETNTNIAAALHLGYTTASHLDDTAANQVIVLCSGGRLDLTDTAMASILEEVRQQADEGLSLSTVDFGMGSLNNLLLEFLADRGSGSYFYLDSITEANRVFDGGLLLQAHQTVATAARVEVTFDPERIEEYRLIGFERREALGNGNRAPRTIGAGQSVTALYEVKLADDAVMGEVASVRLLYQAPKSPEESTSEPREIVWTVEMADMRMKFDDASPRFRLTATVSEFAEILHQSYHARGSHITDLLPLVRQLATEMVDDPDVTEFALLVERAADLEANLRSDLRQ